MNHERSHSGDRTSSQPKKTIIARPRNRIGHTESKVSPPTMDRFTDNHQIISFHQILWSWLQQSSWSNFGRGLFWGIIVGLTAVISATGGVALTKVDAVEQAISRTIARNTHQAPSEVSNLTRPINVLAIEVAPNGDEAIEFSQSLTGESKTILLLEFQPNLGKVRVINIPTDSRVKIPGYGWGTLADANQYGGTTLVSQLVVQLLDGIAIDRYIYATPETFKQLIASGKIKFNNCDRSIENCSSKSEPILRQQIATETIRQRLNIPDYFDNFESSFTKLQGNLDTNLSVPEAMSIANFVKELEPEEIVVNLLSKYVSGTTIDRNTQLPQSSLSKSKFALNRANSNPTSSRNSNLADLPQQIARSSQLSSAENISIAVQNTTENPELGMRLVSYLRSHNFQDVYLVEHIPLRLDKTRIIINQNQIAKAKHLKNILGLGSLEQKLSTIPQPLTIQIGKDARDLPLNNHIDKFIK